MLKLVLFFAKLVRKEPCSIQREVLNRLAKKRGAWDLSSSELIELYEHMNAITKKRTGPATISPSEFFTLLKYPDSASNFLNDRKVPVNDLESFKKRITG
ncbi:MAG: Uncharacterised protein [Cryomorphaceae bacterium]|nr:MAG: Uncharacterised protein [Cryomorphaceae bacterium]